MVMPKPLKYMIDHQKGIYFEKRMLNHANDHVCTITYTENMSKHTVCQRYFAYHILKLHRNKVTGSYIFSTDEVNEYTYRSTSSAIVTFVSLLSGSQLLMKRICSCRSKFFPLRVDLFGSIQENFFEKWKKENKNMYCALYLKSGNIIVFTLYSLAGRIEFLAYLSVQKAEFRDIFALMSI